MNKLQLMNELGELANRFAIALGYYAKDHEGYAGETEDKKPIIIGSISASIQNGELATIEASIGSADSVHKLRINRYPNSNSSEWSVEDK